MTHHRFKYRTIGYTNLRILKKFKLEVLRRVSIIYLKQCYYLEFTCSIGYNSQADTKYKCFNLN